MQMQKLALQQFHQGDTARHHDALMIVQIKDALCPTHWKLHSRVMHVDARQQVSSH